MFKLFIAMQMYIEDSANNGPCEDITDHRRHIESLQYNVEYRCNSDRRNKDWYEIGHNFLYGKSLSHLNRDDVLYSARITELFIYSCSGLIQRIKQHNHSQEPTDFKNLLNLFISIAKRHGTIFRFE